MTITHLKWNKFRLIHIEEWDWWLLTIRSFYNWAEFCYIVKALWYFVCKTIGNDVFHQTKIHLNNSSHVCAARIIHSIITLMVMPHARRHKMYISKSQKLFSHRFQLHRHELQLYLSILSGCLLIPFDLFWCPIPKAETFVDNNAIYVWRLGITCVAIYDTSLLVTTVTNNAWF